MSNINDKIKAVVQSHQLASLATITEDGKPWTRYVMVTGKDDLKISIATAIKSRKIGQIQKNPAVHLNFGVTSIQSAECYVQVEGDAEVKTDATTLEANWNEHLKAYFSGPEDKNYAIIEVTPSRIEYWTMMSMKPEVWER